MVGQRAQYFYLSWNDLYYNLLELNIILLTNFTP
jgi:hypothetical protein